MAVLLHLRSKVSSVGMFRSSSADLAFFSTSTQMGKPFSIPKEDYILRSARSWFRQPDAQKTDGGMCGMVDMHRILVRQTSSYTGLRLALTSSAPWVA